MQCQQQRSVNSDILEITGTFDDQIFHKITFFATKNIAKIVRNSRNCKKSYENLGFSTGPQRKSATKSTRHLWHVHNVASASGIVAGPGTRTSFHVLSWYISIRITKILRIFTTFYRFLTVFGRNRKILKQRKTENWLSLA